MSATRAWTKWGAWQAIRDVFPGARVKGCVFHRVQAVWRNVQHHGLQQTYIENEAVHRYIRQLMALPFLPAVQIEEAFNSLKPHADRLPQLVNLVSYMERQWFRNPVFRVEDWSVFRHTVRTNNDVEGITKKLGVAKFIKESFINKPELAVPLVGFPLLLAALGIRYSLRIQDIDEARKFKSEYTIVRYEDLKEPDRPYFN